MGRREDDEPAKQRTPTPELQRLRNPEPQYRRRSRRGSRQMVREVHARKKNNRRRRRWYTSPNSARRHRPSTARHASPLSPRIVLPGQSSEREGRGIRLGERTEETRHSGTSTMGPSCERGPNPRQVFQEKEEVNWRERAEKNAKARQAAKARLARRISRMCDRRIGSRFGKPSEYDGCTPSSHSQRTCWKSVDGRFGRRTRAQQRRTIRRRLQRLRHPHVDVEVAFVAGRWRLYRKYLDSRQWCFNTHRECR